MRTKRAELLAAADADNIAEIQTVNRVTNKGGGLSPEPGIAQIRQALAEGRMSINKCNTELISQLRLFHRGEDYKPVKAHDDLVDALRYAWMAKDHAKMLDQYDGIGYGRAPFANQRRMNSGPLMAKNIDFPLWDSGKSQRTSKSDMLI